ncbi:MAG: SPASM domain-containing protein [Bacteriovoracaceae bacterium]|nr:SPASM domain-containing protein [Bacteriovoracaceae bacterium]
MKDNQASPKYPTPLELLELFSENNLPENFCIVPFTNLILNPNGDVGVCRQKGTKHVVGNILGKSLDEIWNSDELKSWRQEFLTGNISTCAKEIKNDSCHLSPDNYTLFPLIELSEIQSQPLLKLTANFNGQCNLKCTMCDIWMMENGLYDRIGFWDRAETDFFPYIKEIELLSGEPFIQKDTYRLIEKISEVNPDVLWSFTTNAHWKLTDKIKSQLDKIKIKNIICSVDSLDPVLYSSIRKEGRLEVVLQTIKDLKTYEKSRDERGLSPLSLTLHFLVMKNNYHELPVVVDFVDSMAMRLTINNCYEPKELSLWSLPPEEEFEVAMSVLKNCDETKLKRLTRFFLSVANDLPKIDKATLLSLIKGQLSGSRKED